MSASLLQCFWKSTTANLVKSCNVLKIISVSYAKKVPTTQMKKPELPVEREPEKLLQFCCGANIYKEGVDPELKPHSEYPEWLWELRTERTPVPLEELDEDSPEYWRRLRRITLTNQGKRLRLKKRRTMRFVREK